MRLTLLLGIALSLALATGCDRGRVAKLEQQNAELRRDLQRAQDENRTLTEKLKAAEQGQGAVAQLNTDLLAQKQSRESSESSLGTGRAGFDPTAPAVGAASIGSLQGLRAPPSDAVATAELRPKSASGKAGASPRHYTVQPGDTLEKIAERVLGAANQWGKIYAANADLLSTSQGLKPGMELQLPEK